MNTRTKIAGLLAGILAALLIAVPLWSVAASSLEVQPAKTQTGSIQGGFDNQSPLIIPAADFRSDGVDPYDDYYFIFSTGALWGDTNNYGCQQAQAYLPDGANINQFNASVVDNDTGGDLFVRLWTSGNYNNSGSDSISLLTTTGASTDIQVLGDFISNTIVDYPYYNYYVTVCMHTADNALYSARIWYDFNSNVYTPVIKK